MIRPAKQTGYILLPVIVVITLVAAIALLMNTESALESNIAASELDAQQAQYVAEAGLNHALWLSQQQGCGPYSDLTDEPLGSDIYSSKLTTDLGGTSAYTISVDQDSWIRGDQPTQNFATDLTLNIRDMGGVEWRSVLRYNLTLLAVKAPVISATAWFYVSLAHPQGATTIHRITADWTETDATWNTLGDKMDDAVLASIPAQPAAGVWVAVNLTPQVQAWVNGEPNYGIMLNASVDGINSEYASRESTNAPYLEVIVGAPPSSPAALKADATLANGVKRSIIRNDVVLRQNPSSFVQWQHDAVQGIDAYIWEFSPTTRYGNDDETWVSYSNNNDSLSLFKFNVDKLLPGTNILDATLSLLHQSGAGSNVPVSAHRIVNPWDEADVTWRERVSGTDWDTFGGDLDNGVVSTTLVGPTSNIRYEWDLTSLAQGWADGAYPNYGVALRTLQTNAFGERFYTSDETIESRRPRLTITYACACGEVCVTPQGSGNLLMIVVDPITLVAADAAKKSQFESWGYTVSVLDRNANQAEYDAAVATADVVFISETVSGSNVGERLVNAPIGVVSAAGDYNEDLGFADDSAWTVASAIDVTDNSHYITAPFALGALQIYRHAMEQLTVSGSEAAGLQTLADSAGSGALVLLDTGDTTGGEISGDTAAGRRVMLPLGRDGNFVWDQLNNNGRLIVQRALEWSAGNKGVVDTDTIILSTHDNAELGGLVFTPADLVEYDLATDTATLYFNGATLFTDPLEKVQSVQVLSNGQIILSTRDSATLGGLSFTQADLVEYDAGTGIATLFFNGAALFSDPATRIASAQVLANGLIILSTWVDATLGGLTFTSVQLVEYDPATDTASLYFDGTTLFNDPLDKIDAVHVIDNGHIVLSTWAASTLGGLSFGEGDLVEYDPVTDTSTLYFDGAALFADPLEKLVAVHIGPGSGGPEVIGPYNVLFVVSNVGGPGMTTEEIAHQDLIEGWGHTIEIIDNAASQAAFDSAVANNDVVFTTNDITASTLGTKLVNATIGVVTSEDNLSDEFGLASAIAWESGTLVEINDNTHYITSPFPTGVLTILTASESLAYVTGSLSPDLGLLASSTSGYGIVTLEAGDALFGGGNAAGRRAQLPWGGNGFDPGNLNADGLTILKRAIEWGAGAGSGGPAGPIAHWKLDETSGTTALDSVGGYDGTLVNGPVWEPGKLDGGLSFDGNDDYIDVSSMNPRSYDDLTIVAWYKSADTSVSDDEYIFEHIDFLVDEVSFAATDDGGDRLRFGFTVGGTWFPHYGTSDIVDNQWHHLVAVRSGGRVKLYVDGVKETDEIDNFAGVTVTIDGDGPFIGDYPGQTEQVHGNLDDVRLYDRGLDDAEIADLFAEGGGGGGGPGYTELYQPWSATTSNTWQTVDLSVYGVPADAVVEVALENKQQSGEFWAGARAVGSSLERRFLLHEAEGGGVDTVTLHVQADASGQIQHYSGSSGFVSFNLLGYWTGATYVERFDAFKAGANASWQPHDLGAYGVGPDQVAEIALSQTSTSIEWLVGARRPGSGLARRISLHEAEGGGIDMVTLMAATDASSIVEVYAEADSVVDFHLLGYWSTPPGTYTETGGVHGQATVSTSWQTTDLSGFGIPANSIAQFVMSNERDARENQMGLRETGSTINNRRLDLQEAESGGGDLATMHVKVDASSQIQWAAEYGATEGFFYPVGWWDLTP